MTAWEQLAGILVRWYVLAIILYAALWIIWVLSGSNFYNMITNMIAGLSGLLAIIIVIGILKRKVNLNN